MKRSVYLFLTSVALVSSLAKKATADSEHFPESAVEVMQSCPAFFGGNLPADITINNQLGVFNFYAPNYSTPDMENTNCWDFTWINPGGVVFGSDLIFNATLKITPTWAGRVTSSPWDCNHSNIDYGVFMATSGNNWTLVGGGQKWGKLVNGVCQYSVGNFPTGWGADVFAMSVSWLAPAKFRVAVRSWSHNDVGLGHPGNECTDPINCLWPTKMKVSKL